MRLSCAFGLALALVVAGAVRVDAQVPMPGGSVPGVGPQGLPPCFNEFVPLRQEAERRANLINAAAKRKGSRTEVCRLITSFAQAEAKLVKYAEENQTWCGIPGQAVAQLKANHERTEKARAQICSADALGAQPGPPAGPRLSDELGLNRVPTPGTTSTGRGTLDTLTGNPIR